jgi:hypothetical protein
MSRTATHSFLAASVEVKRLIFIMSFLVSSRSRFLSFALALSVLALPASAGSSPEGIENFYQVDQNVYRGAQPTDDGFKYLAKIGVKTVIDCAKPTKGRSTKKRRSLPPAWNILMFQ